MAENQMVSVLDELYSSSINLLRERLRSGIGRCLATNVIERVKGQAFYTNSRNIRVTLGRGEIIEIIENANFVWENRLDQAKFGTAVAQLDIALRIISDEILKEAKNLGWDLSAFPEPPLVAMTGSQKSGPSNYIVFGVVVP